MFSFTAILSRRRTRSLDAQWLRTGLLYKNQFLQIIQNRTATYYICTSTLNVLFIILLSKAEPMVFKAIFSCVLHFGFIILATEWSCTIRVIMTDCVNGWKTIAWDCCVVGSQRSAFWSVSTISDLRTEAPSINYVH